ncbi:hypothetical protein ACIQUQ_24320 [Streptomyces sp. NPDC101118]|uniref:hypothetical protein n=1 Tax=Streptomyces sp. NPDC101118 TaxID=3366109 RepID=UPI00382E5588
MRTRTRTIGLGIALTALVVSGCGTSDEGEPEPSRPQSFSATQVCGGSVVLPSSAKALERLTGAVSFVPGKEKQELGIPASAQVLEDAYKAGYKVRDMPGAYCVIRGDVPSAKRYSTVKLEFTAYSEKADLPDYAKGRLEHGKGTMTGLYGSRTSISFDCVSSRVGSTPAIPLRVNGRITAFADPEPPHAAEDRMLILHTASLSLAKELGCRNNGGLPDAVSGLPEPLPPLDRDASPSPSR